MHRGPAGHRRALIMEPCGVNCFRLEISQPVVDPLCQLAGNEDHQKVAQIVHVALYVALSITQKCVTIPKSSASISTLLHILFLN